jgi:ribosomal protein S18 acetylase RimI-like enzyme
VETAPGDPWLSALVPEGPDVDLAAALAEVGDVPLAVFACGGRQVDAAAGAGFTELVERQPAMGAELEVDSGDAGGVERDVGLAELGALNDLVWGTDGLERTLARLPAGSVRTYGRRADDGRLVCGGLVFDHGDDASLQYVVTHPDARRAGRAMAVTRAALADAMARGARTATLTASEAGRPLYERLGFRPVGTVALLRRPARR